MNIFIPIGGTDARFAADGYDYPKPLVNALGKPILFWLLDSLVTRIGDVVYIAYIVSRFDFELKVRRAYPDKTFHFIELHSSTRGAAETIHIMSEHVPEARKGLNCITLDSDTFYQCDVLQKCRQVFATPDTDGGVLCFETDDPDPIYSYVVPNPDNDGLVQRIAEKQKVSRLANTGCYMFRSTMFLQQICKAYFGTWDTAIEPYISMLLMNAIKTNGARIRYMVISPDQFVVLGTPFQLKLYCHLNNSSNRDSRYRFCFDLDGTLVSRTPNDTDYSNVVPISRNVEMLRFLHSLGHTIIIHTARRMRTHNGNVGAVIADIGAQTIRTLQSLNIPYDELVFGKPYAHFYVDDLAVNPGTEDLAKVTGFYPASVSERHFNSVRKTNVSVIEKTSSDLFTLEGEMHWYEHMPNTIADLFPRYYGRMPNGYRMENLEGIPFAYLCHQNNLTCEHLRLLLTALKRIHESYEQNDDVDIYANYCKKIADRQSAECYSSLIGDPHSHFARLMHYFEQYEAEQKGVIRNIHGDPVFSNVMLVDDERRIKLFDMRGRQGSLLSLQGDMFYDYAKVYQCLMGYDSVLLGAPLQKAPLELMDCFWDHVGREHKEQVQMICQSLVLTLIPLHEKHMHQALFEFFLQVAK